MRIKGVLIMAGLISLAQADDACCNKGWFLSAGLGTTGVNVDLGYTMNPTFRTRLNISGAYHMKRNLSIGIYEMEDVRIRLGMVRFLMDWHLFKNGLRLTGGLTINENHIKLKKNLKGMVIDGNTMPDGMGCAHVKYDYKKAAPYVGVGFDSGCVGKKGWSVAFDLGCVFAGYPRPHVRLPAHIIAMVPNAQHLAHDYFKKLGHEHKWLHYYPVATIGIRYQL